MNILVVDDDPRSLSLLQKTITGFGYQATVATNGREAMKLMRSGSFRMVVSDMEMPEMGGLDLCRAIRDRYCSRYIFILLLTPQGDKQSIIDGLEAGADECISKPIDEEEVRVRLRTGERILSMESREAAVLGLARLADSHDQNTGSHVERVGEYCRIIAEHLAKQEKFENIVDGEFVQMIYLSSPLHDIGKMGIPDSILLKPGPLTQEEFEIMKHHALAGSKTLESAIFAHPEAKYLNMARDIARSHHERFDGSGYPDGLAGQDIPLCGRIAALADVYDALTTTHVYKPAYNHKKARKIILEGNGTQFDPDIVQAFLDNEHRFQDVHEKYAARQAIEDRVYHPQTHSLVGCLI
jgi:putative two-component system response regulator